MPKVCQKWCLRSRAPGEGLRFLDLTWRFFCLFTESRERVRLCQAPGQRLGRHKGGDVDAYLHPLCDCGLGLAACLLS
jgi:hypothetical protein